VNHPIYNAIVRLTKGDQASNRCQSFTTLRLSTFNLTTDQQYTRDGWFDFYTVIHAVFFLIILLNIELEVLK